MDVTTGHRVRPPQTTAPARAPGRGRRTTGPTARPLAASPLVLALALGLTGCATASDPVRLAGVCASEGGANVPLLSADSLAQAMGARGYVVSGFLSRDLANNVLLRGQCDYAAAQEPWTTRLTVRLDNTQPAYEQAWNAMYAPGVTRLSDTSYVVATPGKNPAGQDVGGAKAVSVAGGRLVVVTLLVPGAGTDASAQATRLLDEVVRATSRPVQAPVTTSSAPTRS